MEEALRNFREKSLAFLRENQSTLSREYPHVIFDIGCKEDWPIYLSALFREVPLDVPDQLALEISFDRGMDGTRGIQADVTWGDGCGVVEGSLTSGRVEVNEERLAEVYADLPRLISVLKTALTRKKPHNWT